MTVSIRSRDWLSDASHILELPYQTVLVRFITFDHQSLPLHLIASVLLILLMLETKRVVSYGKRSTRIIYLSNDNRVSYGSPISNHRNNRENTTSVSPPSAHKVLSRGRKVHGLSTSPRGSPKSRTIFKKPSEHSKGVTPKRRPFGPKNVESSPSIVYLGQKSTQTSNAKLNAFAPFVDSDINLIGGPDSEDLGHSKTIHNRRTRLFQQIADEEKLGTIRVSRRRAVKKPIILSDDHNGDDEFSLKRPSRGARVNPIVISDDESGDHPVPVHSGPLGNAASPLPVETQPDTTLESRLLPKGTSRRLQAEVSIPRLPSALKQPRNKGISFPTPVPVKSARSPRRSHRNAPRLGGTNPYKPPPSTSDLERSFAALSITAAPSRPQVPYHLIPLLAECEQTVPHSFSTFVETFPFDDLHESNSSPEITFRKVGEASYSEVFAIGNVVLKIIPLRDESRVVQQQDVDVDMPQESDSKDVLQEVIVTQAMGRICPGFIKLLRYV